MKRFYKLNNGKVLASYAAPQPDQVLVLLPTAPDNESMWDGEKWVADKEKVDARLAEEVRIEAKAKDLLDNLPSWSAVETAVDNISNLADAKVFLKKLARVVYWLAKDKAD